EMTLIHLQRTAGPAAVSEAGQATAQLAKLYQSEQRTALAADQFRLLATRFAEIRVDGELTGRQVAEQMALAGTLPSTRSLSEWPHGQVRVNVKANPRRGSAYKLTVVSLRESVGNWGTDKLINYDANNQRIELLDEFGQPESSISLEKNALSGAVSFHAKSFGHLLVLSLADRIVAIDTLGDRSGGANTVLWEIPLEEAANSMQMRLQRVPKVVRNPWEWEDMLTTTTDGTLVGELGAVAARGICFQKQRMLMCVDPLTGEVLWNRRDVEAGSTLFGDDERLFLVEPRQNEARVFRMVDGVELESRSLPDERQRWAFRGGRVLTWDGEYYRRQPLRLKMVDVWTGQELWNFDVEGNAKGDLMGTDELGVLQPNGKFVVLNLEDGSAVIQTQVEPEPDLLHIQCLRSRDQYLLLTDRERKNQAGENVMTRASYPKQFGVDRFLTGNVYALDRTTGELSWSRPANIDGYYFPSKQPVGMPVLFFYRMRSERRPTSRGTTNHTDILVLDRRNGQLLLQDSQPKRFQRVDELKAEPADDSVVLQLYG
ncbi:MAG: PQQ-binding-like beta-propeller repeat protein, partial [Planctomycetales bacterium]|nr:PQQ-binding-like beta-propeller repeat protein [Planctomycetales bacterium]